MSGKLSSLGTIDLPVIINISCFSSKSLSYEYDIFQKLKYLPKQYLRSVKAVQEDKKQIVVKSNVISLLLVNFKNGKVSRNNVISVSKVVFGSDTTLKPLQRYMRMPNIFEFIDEEEAVPQIAFDQNDFNVPNRPLTSQEVKQCRFNQMIVTFGLIEEALDINRAEQTINQIHKIYPILDNSIVFDESIRWLRYQPNEHVPTHITLADKVTDLSQLTDYFTKFESFSSSNRLTNWLLVGASIPDLPAVTTILISYVPHAFMGGLSCNLLFKLFNQIYGDKSFDFSAQPSQTQKSFFRSVFAFNQPKGQTSHVAPAVKLQLKTTNATSDGVHDQNKFPNIPSVVNLVQPSRFSKIPGATFTQTFNAVLLAQYAAYLFFHKDLQREQRFLLTYTDIRDISSFLYKYGCVPGLDFSRHLGMSAAVLAFAVHGTAETSVQQLVEQIQASYAKFEATSVQEKWDRYVAYEYSAISKNYPAAPVNLNVSNVGVNQLGCGPVVQVFNHGTCSYVEGAPQFIMIWPCINTGKYGTVVSMLRTPEFSDSQQKQTFEISMHIHRLIKERGAQNVRVSDIVSVYENEFNRM